MIVELVLFLVCLLAILIYKDMKPRGMPPGPMEIPFFGNVQMVETEHVDTMKKYGDIVTTRFGETRQVTIYDYHISKEAMASPACVDRTEQFKDFIMDHEHKKGGVFQSNGIQWEHER